MAIWTLVPLLFLNPVCTSGSSWFMDCWRLAWRIFSITLLACDMIATVQSFEHSLGLPFFGIEMKTDLLQSCGHCWVFKICWHIACSLVIMAILKRSMSGYFKVDLGFSRDGRCSFSPLQCPLRKHLSYPQNQTHGNIYRGPYRKLCTPMQAQKQANTNCTPPWFWPQTRPILTRMDMALSQIHSF